MWSNLFQLPSTAWPQIRDRNQKLGANQVHGLRRGFTLSAAMVILPRVWATAEGSETEIGERIGPCSMQISLVKQARVAQTEAPRLEPRTAPSPAVTAAVLEPELAFYRKYTEGMLRRYMRLSMEAGRTPSLLGRELFRGHVTSYKVRSFDDVVIFVHDVGNCLAKLEVRQQHLIRRIALQQYTQGETAALLGLSLRSVVRLYSDALDDLTAIFLERRMLEPHKSVVNS